MKYAGKIDVKLCPGCLKKGYKTYIPADQRYCDYCLREQNEKFKSKYPGRSPWYLG